MKIGELPLNVWSVEKFLRRRTKDLFLPYFPYVSNSTLKQPAFEKFSSMHYLQYINSSKGN